MTYDCEYLLFLKITFPIADADRFNGVTMSRLKEVLKQKTGVSSIDCRMTSRTLMLFVAAGKAESRQQLEEILTVPEKIGEIISEVLYGKQEKMRCALENGSDLGNTLRSMCVCCSEFLFY